MNSSTINKLPQLESVKRTIRNYKSLSIENCGSPTCAAEIVIPEKYKTSLKGEPFLLYDSGFGDEQRIIIYGTLKFLSLLRNSDSWFCDGTFSVVPDLFTQLYTIQKDRVISLASMPCFRIKLKQSMTDSKKLLEIEQSLNPFTIMIDFDNLELMHWRRILFLLSRDAFFTSRKIYLEAFKNKDWLHDITRIMISLLVLGCVLVWLLFLKSTLLILSLF